jgi:hypothetical protein
MQIASPVCGARNFSSVRLYSAPQLHRTIVAIFGVCAPNALFASRKPPVHVDADFAILGFLSAPGEK